MTDVNEGFVTIEVPLPDDVASYKHDLEFMFNLMVRKLYANRHKGWADEHPRVLFQGIYRELAEMEEAFSKGQFEVIVEGADVANMAVLTAISVIYLTRQDFKFACALTEEEADEKR